ncbi:MAG: thioredoxin-dependent thiol peroxidase [Armatimonadetes bacterium]|nr:thioredoxin-dependent thiol peroxidase [Armatimonadota bacterium]
MSAAAEAQILAEGTAFPNFSLLNQDGETVSHESLKGHPTIVYFYPKDDTSGCTAEACAFRDLMPDFGNAAVIGVSPDSVRSHKKFIEKYSLNFTLLADVDQSLCNAVGVWVEKSMYGKKYMGVERTTFLLDSEGIIRKVWRKVKVDGHGREVVDELAKLS